MLEQSQTQGDGHKHNCFLVNVEAEVERKQIHKCQVLTEVLGFDAFEHTHDQRLSAGHQLCGLTIKNKTVSPMLIFL